MTEATSKFVPGGRWDITRLVTAVKNCWKIEYLKNPLKPKKCPEVITNNIGFAFVDAKEKGIYSKEANLYRVRIAMKCFRKLGGDLTTFDTATGRTTSGSKLQVWYKLGLRKKNLARFKAKLQNTRLSHLHYIE